MKKTNRYVALDVETTGLSPQNGDRVIEIGVVAIEGQSIVDQFRSLIDIDKRIPWQVQQVHGISNEMLCGEPKPAQMHRALDDAKLAAMIFLKTEKI